MNFLAKFCCLPHDSLYLYHGLAGSYLELVVFFFVDKLIDTSIHGSCIKVTDKAFRIFFTIYGT